MLFDKFINQSISLIFIHTVLYDGLVSSTAAIFNIPNPKYSGAKIMVVVLYVMISEVYMTRVSSLYFCKIMPSCSFATSEITPEIGELTAMLKFLFNLR